MCPPVVERRVLQLLPKERRVLQLLPVLAPSNSGRMAEPNLLIASRVHDVTDVRTN